LADSLSGQLRAYLYISVLTYIEHSKDAILFIKIKTVSTPPSLSREMEEWRERSVYK
jgi:hypothetical protein